MVFVQRRLPWLIAAIMLVVYLLTLSRWINYSGLPVASKVLGWDWRPQFLAPLHFLLTYPVRWLPAGGQVIALNLFSAVCAVLTLALLARSVAILPHDRTRDQRAVERSEFSFLSIPAAWLPPLLAVLACGLQLTFWENATTDLGESLDLLVFAYCVRCLLEYRIAQKESWILRLALVGGLGMTNNYAMIAFGPVILAATVWTMGRRFFNGRFLLKVLGCGLLGLSFYALLPAINSFTDYAGQSFFEMMRTYWGYQRKTMVDFPRHIILLLGVPSLLPVAFIGIRWPAQYGDISALGNALANLALRTAHGLFLGLCIYVAFDGVLSGRKLGFGWAFLPFYYLGALTIGYCSGYFLLLYGSALVKPWQRPSLLQRAERRLIVATVWVVLVAVPAGLIFRNLPELKASNSPYLNQFGEAATQCLPAQGAVVLSDDPYRLYALQAALARSGSTGKYVLLDTVSLPQSQYHRYLRQRYPDIWSKLLPKSVIMPDQIDSDNLVRMLVELQRSLELFYLHPSFGYYFEHFYLRPRKLVYQVQPCPTNTVETPLLTADEISENEQYWRKALAGDLAPLIEAMRPRRANELPGFNVAMVGSMYSRALNYFGVELQRAGELNKAGEFFTQALALDTNNPAAYINMEYNQLLRAGQRDNPKPSAGAVIRLAMYGGGLERVLTFGGPLDEPNTCYNLSQKFFATRNYRQAAQLLQRVTFFNPTNYAARLDQINLLNQLRLPDKALEEIAAIRTDPELRARVEADLVPLIQAEAWSYASKRDLETAKKILIAAQEKYPLHPGAFYAETQIYLALQQPTNAIAVLERQIRAQTNNANALINVGAIKINLRDGAGAIPYLNRALEISPQDPLALMNRAIAYLQTGNTVGAERDYQNLLAILPKPDHAVFYGLGETYFQMKYTNQALKYYEEFLKIAPAASPDIPRVKERLKLLKSGST
jgi:tetratricopeptide (TPR) repeat protein